VKAGNPLSDLVQPLSAAGLRNPVFNLVIKRQMNNKHGMAITVKLFKLCLIYLIKIWKKKLRVRTSPRKKKEKNTSLLKQDIYLTKH
jgi:hypothetical protein